MCNNWGMERHCMMQDSHLALHIQLINLNYLMNRDNFHSTIYRNNLRFRLMELLSEQEVTVC